MIRAITSNELKINVFLKNGKKYLNKDIPDRPFGEHEKIVCFWHENIIRGYPINDVEYFELCED